ncbi:uncharacterized protein CFAP92 [Elgaria multicarinata webbii]|uniref:uncharacterized protein CFAP92 n=1 Tax=Elgaria multicarinata webbii TaxID=159646 RepID=UPI002FCD4902
MASKPQDLEEDEEEEAPESKEADFNTPHSESTYGTESPEACGGGHPTPEDENMTHCHSVKSEQLDPQHLVTCTFSVSLAVPLVLPTNKPWTRHDIQSTMSKVREGSIPKMHRFYHMEYFLLPDDIDPRKLDLVLFGPLAKLYLETESKVVKPWLENNQIWVSWNHSIEINVTNDFLIKLRDHNIKLRLWDVKEKVCAKARFSKQKSNVPYSDQGDIEGAVKRTVLYQRDFLERSMPKPSYTKVRAAEVVSVREKSAVSISPGPPISSASKLREDKRKSIDQKTSRRTSAPQSPTKAEDLSCSLSAISISGSIPSSLKEKTIQEAKIIKQKHYQKPSDKTPNTMKSDLKKLSNILENEESLGGVMLQLTGKKKIPQKSVPSKVEKKQTPSPRKLSAKEANALLVQARKFGIASLQLNLMPLLSGEHYVVSRLGEKSLKLYDAYLSFSVDEPLMSEKQKRELNPLIIRIKSARSLPATPVPIEVLQSSCVPVYCKYKFQNMSPHQTQGRDHGTEVFFEDTNVILAGIIKPGELSEYLRGPPMEVEVHDRDKKKEEIKIKPSLFGEEPGDNKLSHLSAVTSRYMLQNPINMEEMWHPYGVAKISLANLLLGEKTLNLSVPIHNCSVQDTVVSQGENITQKARGADGSQIVQLPMGHYVNSESCLKVRVEISVPLGPPDELDDSETTHSPYGCIIYIFDYKNTSLWSYLLREITEINAEALSLDSYPLHIIQKSLNTLKLNHKLTAEEIAQLDIITGFHILDGSIHLLILEGLKNKALKRMFNKRIDRIHETKTGRLQIFYNSHLSFHQRLYVDLEAVIFHIRLCKPLSSIMKQPLLYIRDMVPQPCFEALTRLDYICCSKKLRDVVHYNLLPSAEMITTLSQEFGVPLTKDDLFIQEQPEISEAYDTPTEYFPMKRYKHCQIDNYNDEYIVRKREMELQIPEDYIQSNIENVKLLNKMVKREVPRTIRAFPSDGKSIFNYSIQTLNSAEIAKKLLRQEMAQVPDKRFAYCDEYLSGMFDPVDEDRALKESTEQSKKLWLSPEGFAYPGFKSSIECNMHPRMPDEARLIELQEKWQENFLHATSMKPVLDRDSWRGDKQKVDFQLYKKPPCVFVAHDMYREGTYYHPCSSRVVLDNGEVVQIRYKTKGNVYWSELLGLGYLF